MSAIRNVAQGLRNLWGQGKDEFDDDDDDDDDDDLPSFRYSSPEAAPTRPMQRGTGSERVRFEEETRANESPVEKTIRTSERPVAANNPKSESQKLVENASILLEAQNLYSDEFDELWYILQDIAVDQRESEVLSRQTDANIMRIHELLSRG